MAQVTVTTVYACSDANPALVGARQLLCAYRGEVAWRGGTHKPDCCECAHAATTAPCHHRLIAAALTADAIQQGAAPGVDTYVAPRVALARHRPHTLHQRRPTPQPITHVAARWWPSAARGRHTHARY